MSLKTKVVTKAVFPVAGLGTRFLPATKASPKEMLNVVDKPLIQYAVEEAIAAGIPDDLMPIVDVREGEGNFATYNDPALTRRLRGTLTEWLGAEHVITAEPEMGAEDFSEYGRTVERVPLCLIRLGAVEPAKATESQRTGVPLPSLHSSKFAPVPESTIKTGITAMSAAALELLAAK